MGLASILGVQTIALIENKEDDSTIVSSKEAVNDTLDFIQQLKAEIRHLRLSNNRLLTLLEHNNTNKSS